MGAHVLIQSINEGVLRSKGGGSKNRPQEESLWCYWMLNGSLKSCFTEKQEFTSDAYS